MSTFPDHKNKKMDIEKLITEATEIIKGYKIKKIILFGSYSSGFPSKYSDIDLLVIKDLPESEIRNFRLTLKKALWYKLGNTGYSFDIIVDNEQRIKERIDIGDLFYKDIYFNGRILHA